MSSAHASATSTADLAVRLRLALTRTARRLRQEADSSLTPSTAAALASVERRGPLTPSELAAIEGIQRPTTTRVIARLEEAGLVVRASDPADRRSSLVSVTDEGRALLRKARNRKTAYLAHRMRDLPADDLAALERAADVLERMLEDGTR
ncbi:MAG: MarR family transcriptional regulator [Actinomycetota bacterium]